MKTFQIFSGISNKHLLLVLSLIFCGCGSFQGSSYFDSDGIYRSRNSTASNINNSANNDDYYEKYFRDAAENGYLNSDGNNSFFTDIDSYSSNEYNDEKNSDLNNTQIPWGENPSQTEVILFNNNPNYLWGLSGFAFNYSPFWNNYFNTPFQFGFNGFISPWSNFPMWSPYGRYAEYWRFRGYDTFYNPYNYFGGFFNPYGLGFGFGNRNNWFNRYYNYNRFNDYYGNNIRRSGSSAYRTTIARISSGRGERSNRNSNSQLINKSDRVNSRPRNFEKTITRFNLGRRSGSIGRVSSIGYDRNRVKSSLNYNSIRNSVNLNNSISGNRSSSLLQNNRNILKTPNQRSVGSGRLQTENRLVERNLNRNSSIIIRSPQEVRSQTNTYSRSPSYSRVQEGTYRGARNNTRIQNDNVRRNNRVKPQNSTNYRSYNRSYNVSRSNSTFNSRGVNRPSSGRSNSSGGRGTTH
tara:strand:+ start:3358 stop:4752 length:1395 start_codon:yes stop_codon:yes gene_type:complete